MIRSLTSQSAKGLWRTGLALAVAVQYPDNASFYKIKKISGSRPLNEMSDTGIINLSSDNFNTYKAKIKANLLGRFGPYALKELEIASVGSHPNTRYGILMDKAKIEIVF